MALEPKPLTNVPNTIEPEIEVDVDTSFGEGLASAFRLENTLVSAAEAFGTRGDREQARTRVTDEGIFHDGPNPNYDVFDDIEGTEYAGFAKSFVGVVNPAEARVVKDKIDNELEDRRVLESLGAKGFAAQIIAGVVDPINIIPIGGTAVRGASAGRTIADNAARTALAGAVGAAGAEALLHPTQETRTAEESATAVLGGLLLGGVFGGGVGAFAARHQYRSGSADTLGARLMKDPLTESQYTAKASVGAEQVVSDTIEENTPVGSLGVGKALSFSNLIGRSIYSKSQAGRQAILDLVEQPQIFEKNLEGKPTTSAAGPVESQVTLATGEWVQLEENLFDLFIQRQKGRSAKFGDRAVTGIKDVFQRNSGNTLTDFRNEISDAFLVPGDHADPIIKQAVDAYSAKFEEYGREAERLGIIEKGSVEAAKANGGRYIPVDYEIDIIARNPTEWKSILSGHFQRNAEGAEQELVEVSEQLVQLKKQRADLEANLPDARILSRVRAGGAVDLGFDKKPVIEILKSLGGIDPDSVLAGELRNVGLSSTTAPGAFRKGGLKNVDDIVISEFEVLADNLPVSETGLADPNDIIELVSRELFGNPARTLDELARIEAETQPIDDLIRFLDDNDIDYMNLTDDQVRQRLLNLDEVTLKKIASSGQEGDTGLGSTRSLADIEAEDAQQSAVGVAPRETSNQSITDRISRLEEKAETLRKLSRASERIDADDLADEVTERLLGSRGADLPDDIISGPRGPLRGKTLNIDPALTKDFRNTNISDLSRKYIRVSKVDLGLVKKFGSTDLRKQFQKVRDDFDVLTNKLVTSKARALLKDGELDNLSDIEKSAIIQGNRSKIGEIEHEDFINKVLRSDDLQNGSDELLKQRKQLEADLTTALTRVRGQTQHLRNPNTAYERTRRTILAANFVRLLGGQTASAIPDLGMPIFRFGFKAFTQGYGQLAVNLKNWKLGAEELRYWTGTGVDLLDSQRIQSISETYRGAGSARAFDKFIDESARVFGIATLMAPWNALMKAISGSVVSGYVNGTVKGLAATVRKADALPAKERAAFLKKEFAKRDNRELVRMNISPELAVRISDQIEKYAPNFNKDRQFNYGDWDDIVARDNLRQAIAGEVDRTILTPKNHKPSWQDNPEGQVVLQFKSFGFEASQTILVAGLQRRDAQSMMGLVTMVALGGLVYKIKEARAGREVPDFTDNPGKWITEGIDRSGMFGWLMDVNNVAEKLSSGNVGLSALSGGQVASRFQSRNAVGAIAGPTLGLLQDAGELSGAASAGNWTEKDTARLRRLVPYQNAIGFKRLFDEFEDGFNKSLGIDN